MEDLKKEPTEKDFLEYYNKHSISDTARYYGVGRKIIYRWCKLFGAKLKAELKPTKEEFSDYYNAHTSTNTAKHFNIGRKTAYDWAKKFKLEPKAEPIIEIRPPFKELSEYYHLNGSKKTLNYFGTTIGNLYKWLRHYGLQTERQKTISELSLNSRQLQIITGSLLGDGTVTKINDKHRNSYFAECHCASQRDYLEWKKLELDKFVKHPLIYCENTPSRFEGESTYKLFTKCHPDFTKLENKWYKRNGSGDYILNDVGNRIKVIPEDIELTPLTIAVWFLDDGTNYLGKNIRISTEGFSFNEVELLIEKLKNFELNNCKIQKTSTGKPKIYIGASSHLNFINLISPAINHIKCMKYKLIIQKPPRCLDLCGDSEY